MIKIKLDKYFEVKSSQKDILINTSSVTNSENIVKRNEIFPIKQDRIYIGEKKYPLEELLLNKIPLDDNIIKTIEEELRIIKDRLVYSVKNKKDLITKLKSKSLLLDKLTQEVLSNRNAKVIDVLNVISNSYKNIINNNIVHSDNILVNNDNYLFFNGERVILNKNQYTLNEISKNYKIEINIDKMFVSYIVPNDILKTLDTFKIYFIDGNTQVHFIKEYSLKNKFIEVNKKCTKIIIEGIGANDICKDIKICVGQNKTNINRGVAIVECDFSKVKIADKYHISAHEDIKIFSWKKTEVDFLLPYKDFKEKYYSLDKLVTTNKSTDVNLIDNYLILFIETNLPATKKIKIYGVDK